MRGLSNGAMIQSYQSNQALQLTLHCVRGQAWDLRFFESLSANNGFWSVPSLRSRAGFRVSANPRRARPRSGQLNSVR